MNKSQSSICVEVLSTSSINSGQLNPTSHYLESEINPGKSRNLSEAGRNGWEKRIDNSFEKKINIVVFKIDSIKKYGDIDYLVQNNIYDLYSLSKSDLDKIDWKFLVVR